MKRRIILICIAIILAAGSVFAAATAPTASRKAGTKQVQKQGCKANKKQSKKAGVYALLKKLNLTAVQKTRIKAICKEAAARIKAVKADKSLAAAQAKVNIKGIRKAEWAQVKQVLTAEQLKKLKALMKQGKKRGK